MLTMIKTSIVSLRKCAICLSMIIFFQTHSLGSLTIHLIPCSNLSSSGKCILTQWYLADQQFLNCLWTHTICMIISHYVNYVFVLYTTWLRIKFIHSLHGLGVKILIVQTHTFAHHALNTINLMEYMYSKIQF